jgi:aspartyl-tRNA(Asn)/glutamyl-tRNA(Gln) amidotransferase subunit C
MVMPLPPHGPDEVRRIAALARIRLTDDEAASLAKDFARILEYVDRLRTRDEADAVEPLVHAVPSKEPAASLRADRPGTGGPAGPLRREEVLAAAPAASGGLLRVPRVLEEGR